MNLFSKVWNKVVDTYYNISEKFYKTTYWEYELESDTVYCSISGGKMYITLEDYRLMESDSIGRIVLKDLKEGQVPIKVVV